MEHRPFHRHEKPSSRAPVSAPSSSRVPKPVPVFVPGMPVSRSSFAKPSSPTSNNPSLHPSPVAYNAIISEEYSWTENISPKNTSSGKPRPVSMLGPQANTPPAPSFSRPETRKSSGGHGASRSLDYAAGLPVHGEKSAIDLEFEAMMLKLEVPLAVRTKMNTMDQHVKSAFLKNSQSFKLATGMSSRPTDLSPREPSPSLNPPAPSLGRDSDYFVVQKPTASPRSSKILNPRSILTSSYLANNSASPSKHKADRADNRSKGKKAGAEMMSGGEGSVGSGSASPVGMARWLRDGPPAEVMDLGKVKKLRMLLRQETTVWIEVFLQEGGYAYLLKKLTEVLDMEWREEQHDDQLLHELLRCVKALSTSDIGCIAIRQQAPNPFIPLTALLFSEKKPGDVPTRQLMVELVLILFDLYPTEGGWAVPREWSSLPVLVRRLMVGPEKENDLVEFVTVAHRPRIFKTYLTEIADVCRDYFWMFCHGNGIWRLADLDVSLVERPTAPGGATGGVEYEAGNYLVVHFRLINSEAKACYELGEHSESDTSAWRFHAQLFESGLDRVILSARKASTTYYPHLHLELARYVALAQQAQYELPYQVQRLIEPPPTTFRKVNGREAEGLPSQGLNGGRHGPGRSAVGRGLPVQAADPGQVDDRFIFQAPMGKERHFSPAPQLTRDIIQSDNGRLLT